MSHNPKNVPLVQCTGVHYAETHDAKPWVFTFRLNTRGRGTFSLYRNSPDAFQVNHFYRLAIREDLS